MKKLDTKEIIEIINSFDDDGIPDYTYSDNELTNGISQMLQMKNLSNIKKNKMLAAFIWYWDATGDAEVRNIYDCEPVEDYDNEEEENG